MNILLKTLLAPAALALAATAHAAPGNVGASATQTEATRGAQAEPAKYHGRADRRGWRRDNRRYHGHRHYRGPRYYYGPRYYGRPYYAPPRCYWSRYYHRRVCRY
jgi:hypothetical protein